MPSTDMESRRHSNTNSGTNTTTSVTSTVKLRRNSMSAYPIDVHGSTMICSPTELTQRRHSKQSNNYNNGNAFTDNNNTVEDDDKEDHDDDLEDKTWRTRGEPWRSPLCSPSSVCLSTTHMKRQHFWRNIVRQFNFTNEAERQLVVSLTKGIDWMRMPFLPTAFMDRHREIYYLIATPDYARSSTIQRDVTRTFSIFEYSQLRGREVGAQQRSLFRVLNAIAEAEDGYCQGMNFIAALFLVEGLEEADAYALFLYLLKKRHLARLYQRSSTFLDDYLHQFELLLQRELPDLYYHLQAQGFVIPMYGIEWFTTLFSLSTKLDLAVAIFDLFFIGVQDIFLRMGLAILKLLESKLMCMTFEDFLREFKPLVRQIDPYQAILKALSFSPNLAFAQGEDTTACIARAHFERAAKQTAQSRHPVPPKSFDLHRTLPPDLADAIARGESAMVATIWQELTQRRAIASHRLVLANEMLHHAIWHGHVALALFALEEGDADPNNLDDTNLTPLHFAVIRNQPDLVRVLLCFGADATITGGRWSGAPLGLSPLETSRHWSFRDTTAARLVLEHQVCLFCNTRFDGLAAAFSKETCTTCRIAYCRRPHAMCIQQHQCPCTVLEHRRRRRRQSQLNQYESTIGSDTLDALTTQDGTDLTTTNEREQRTMSLTTPSTASSRRSSRSRSYSASDSSSSFVFVQSPANFPVQPSSQPVTPSSSLLGSIVDWFGALTSSTDSLSLSDRFHEDDDGTERRERVVLVVPDRPEWYCNARECHSVFAFFSQGLTCATCHGQFCSSDFESKSKQCRACTRQAEN